MVVEVEVEAVVAAAEVADLEEAGVAAEAAVRRSR